MTNPIDVDADAARLAAELASLLGRERGNLLLQQARTAVLAESAKPGTETSEFKMALLGVVSGFAVLALGALTWFNLTSPIEAWTWFSGRSRGM